MINPIDINQQAQDEIDRQRAKPDCQRRGSKFANEIQQARESLSKRAIRAGSRIDRLLVLIESTIVADATARCPEARSQRPDAMLGPYREQGFS